MRISEFTLTAANGIISFFFFNSWVIFIVYIYHILFLYILYIHIHSWGFPDGTGGKEPTCQCRRRRRCGFDPCVGKIPWRRATIHSSLPAWRAPWTEEPGRLQCVGSQRVGPDGSNSMQAYVPTGSVRGSLSSMPSLAFIVCRLFDGGHSDWCEVWSTMGFHELGVVWRLLGNLWWK